MLRARKAGILTPVIFSVQNEAATIFMERIDGVTVKETLLSGTLTEQGTRQLNNLLRTCTALFANSPQPVVLQRSLRC